MVELLHPGDTLIPEEPIVTVTAVEIALAA